MILKKVINTQLNNLSCSLGRGHFTIGLYRGVHSKNFCYDPMPDCGPSWEFEIEYQNMDVFSNVCFHYKKHEHFQN